MPSYHPGEEWSQKEGGYTPRPAGAPKERLYLPRPDEIIKDLLDIDPEDEPPASLLPFRVCPLQVPLVLCEFDDPLDEGMDTGNILLKEKTPISQDDTA